MAAGKVAGIFRRTCPDADIVHVHLFPALLTIPRALKKVGYRGNFTATEHSTSNRRRGTFWGGVADRVTYRSYRKVVCISPSVERSLVSWQPYLNGRTVVIPNGVSLDRFSSGSRSGFHSPAVILSEGRLTTAKNYQKAISAVELLAETTHLPLRWQIAGEGPLEQVLKARGKDLVSRGIAEFLGKRDDIPELMKNSDIFFMPSLWEGFGIGAVEAMASGLPIVAGNVPGLREVVGEDTGVLVDPASEHDQADALASLLGDPSKAIAMGINGIRRATGYSIGKCAKSHLELYGELLLRAER